MAPAFAGQAFRKSAEFAPCRLRVGMNVDDRVIPVPQLVNIYFLAGTRAIPRLPLFNNPRTCFLYDYLGRRRCRGRRGGCFCGGGSYWRGRLLTSGDPE